MALMSDAAVYRCPSCGAPNEPSAAACAWCRAELRPVRCPWCFAWVDARAQGCARCGARAGGASAESGDGRPCPSCRDEKVVLVSRALGRARLAVCGACSGIWADAGSFKLLCEDRAVQAAYMGQGSALSGPATQDPSADGIFYRPCPICAEMMNRFNFAGCSGVILDACRPHGVWFDADELARIVAFIRGGGLDVARERERLELELARQRLEKAHDDLAALHQEQSYGPRHVYAAGGLLGFLLKP
jgi:Zn-finger nucleic acid-binding protein